MALRDLIVFISVFLIVNASVYFSTSAGNGVCVTCDGTVSSSSYTGSYSYPSTYSNNYNTGYTTYYYPNSGYTYSNNNNNGYTNYYPNSNSNGYTTYYYYGRRK
ncbi:unnamed protein product, partial [Mesorhabditis belari]|uniref:Uncharacterized protein n=1 Tax=Mesorhabditis belari TaxID=2138241 RepID=A0AAF3EHK7_9BILA